MQVQPFYLEKAPGQELHLSVSVRKGAWFRGERKGKKKVHKVSAELSSRACSTETQEVEAVKAFLLLIPYACVCICKPVS